MDVTEEEEPDKRPRAGVRVGPVNKECALLSCDLLLRDSDNEQDSVHDGPDIGFDKVRLCCVLYV